MAKIQLVVKEKLGKIFHKFNHIYVLAFGLKFGPKKKCPEYIDSILTIRVRLQNRKWLCTTLRLHTYNLKNSEYQTKISSRPLWRIKHFKSILVKVSTTLGVSHWSNLTSNLAIFPPPKLTLIQVTCQSHQAIGYIT